MSKVLGSLPSLDEIEPKIDKSDKFDWGISPSDEFSHVAAYHETGWVGFINLDQILSKAIEVKASDVHINTGLTTTFTINGDKEKQGKYVKPGMEEMQDLIREILNNVQYNEYLKDKDFVFAYVIKRGPYRGTRWRGIASGVSGGEGLTFRLINSKIPSLNELKIEKEILKWANYPDGLFLICGATGTGKSTTLASVMRNIQLTKKKKIITVEDPIEYPYTDDGLGLVVQREIGPDVRSYGAGLTAAMRQDPDIILIGEVRTGDELNELIRAGETGHLGISTLHTNSVATTINRIQGMFDGAERLRILSTLSDTLRGVCNQVLVKSIDGGRFACREILTINDEVSKMIANGDVSGIRNYQKSNRTTMEWKLAEAVIDGKCTEENAREKSSFPYEFDEALQILKYMR